jgi:hypothetical protein
VVVAGNRHAAIEHAHTIAALELKLHFFVEPHVGGADSA